MPSAKEIFKANVLRLSKKVGVVGGASLARLTKKEGSPGIEKTYGNSLLNERDGPINLTLDKAEIIAEALGATLSSLLVPLSDSFITLPLNEQSKDELAEAITIVKRIAKDQSIENANFEAKLVSYLFFAKVTGIAETDRYAEIVRITRDFSKNDNY